jgi:hypothetical protein
MSLQPPSSLAIAPTHATATAPPPQITTDLGPLQLLVGNWVGQGFNNIWRPFNGPGSDHFLELNLTSENLAFAEINGPIPNRGLLQPDITMFGVNYVQQITDVNTQEPIHFEVGLWVNIPVTSQPQEPATVARLASIPHGTVMLAQGTIEPTIQGPPQFSPQDITPFKIGQPGSLVSFTNETTLSNSSPFRSPPDAIKGVTQAMVDNPNSVLQAVIANQKIIETVTLNISTVPTPVAGGGTANTAFLQGATPGDGNADAAQVDATFWIETVQEPNGTTFRQLQYSQRVLLNFATLSWPHVSVATLRFGPPPAT